MAKTIEELDELIEQCEDKIRQARLHVLRSQIRSEQIGEVREALANIRSSVRALAQAAGEAAEEYGPDILEAVWAAVRREL